MAKTIDLRKLYDPSTNSKQVLAHKAPEKDVLYCGARGGGKTAWLVNEAIRLSLDFPGNVGYLCRFRATDFNSSTMLELEKFLPPELILSHHKTENYYKIIAAKKGNEVITSTIFYGGLSGDEETKSKINSMNLGWFGIDQAEEVSEMQFQLLCATLRLMIPNIRYKGLLTCNPEPGWLRDRFIEHSKPDHRFVSALPSDNAKYLPPDYSEKLREIYPEAMAKRLLEGNWDIDISGNYLIPYADIRNAVNRELDISGDVVAGVDLARYGADESVFIARQGDKVIGIESWSKQDEVDSAGFTAQYIRKYKPTMTYLDVVNLSGVYDILNRENFSVTPVNVGEGADNNKLYANKRAEYFERLRRRFIEGTIDIPDHPKLASQLASLRFHYREARLLMEAKKDMNKSPDYADALMLAFSGGDKFYGKMKPIETLTFGRKESAVVERWIGK